MYQRDLKFAIFQRRRLVQNEINVHYNYKCVSVCVCVCSKRLAGYIKGNKFRVKWVKHEEKGKKFIHRAHVSFQECRDRHRELIHEKSNTIMVEHTQLTYREKRGKLCGYMYKYLAQTPRFR